MKPRVLMIAVLIAGGLLTAAQARPGPDNGLAGYWAGKIIHTEPLGGTLTVKRDGSTWRARLAGAETAFAPENGAVTFRFEGRGGFRGRISDDGAITGFWLQPPGGSVDSTDPGGSGQPFASALTLKSTGSGTWRGEVVPLTDQFTLYLHIFRDDDGTLLGAFRNPEMNAIGGTTRFHVTRQGETIIFSRRFDDGSPEIRGEATLLTDPERLRIRWPEARATIDLMRRASSEIPGFFPRPPADPPYTYHQPLETNDGWRTAHARQVGIDPAALTRVVREIIKASPSARRPQLIHSILVARRGKLVLEEYFFGHDRDTQHDTRSAGKTFASVMMGAAMLRGTAITPETRAYDVLTGLGSTGHPDPRKSRITLAHLMTHTSGLDCNDADPSSPGNEGVMQSQTAEPDWWLYTLDLPMRHDPGSRYAYCSAGMNLMGGVLTVATGTWLPELFDRTIARPLHFGRYYWNLMPTREGYLGGGVFLRPRDLLKVGQVYLDGGVWRGRRIVTAEWVARSAAPHVEISPETTGMSPEEFQNFYPRGWDGYAWHVFNVRSGGRVIDAFEANGNGGQMVIVVPGHDLTVAFTGGNYMQGGIWSRWRDDIVGGKIIPALKD